MSSFLLSRTSNLFHSRSGKKSGWKRRDFDKKESVVGVNFVLILKASIKEIPWLGSRGYHRLKPISNFNLTPDRYLFMEIRGIMFGKALSCRSAVMWNWLRANIQVDYPLLSYINKCWDMVDKLENLKRDFKVFNSTHKPHIFESFLTPWNVFSHRFSCRAKTLVILSEMKCVANYHNSYSF